jgi:cell division transport system ATP-binding protein
MSVLERINASGTTIIMATHEAMFVDQMKKRVIELSQGQIVRDERHGGYGVTAAIPLVKPQAAPEPENVTLATGVIVPVVPTAPASEPAADAAAPAAAASAPAAPQAQTQPQAQPDAVDNVRPITSAVPVQHTPQHPAEMSLAARLGLRANGTDGGDFEDQNVGPVK